MKIINQSNGSLIGEVGNDRDPFFSRGDSLSIEGVVGRFRVVEIHRDFRKHRNDISFCVIEDVAVFVIPISENSERLPHED